MKKLLQIQRKNGFTLIELLVVIAIIGLLGSIVAVSINSARQKGKVGAGMRFASSLYHGLGSEIVGAWDFDEGSGSTANDLSGYGYNGAILGTATWSSDTPNAVVGTGSGKYALSFDGSTNAVDLGTYAQLPRLQFGTGNFTIAAWIKTSGNGRIVDIYSCDHDIYLSVASGKANFDVRDINHIIAVGTTTVNDNTWHFLAGVRNGDEVIVYVDGIKERTMTGAAAASVPGPNNQAHWRIGSSNACTTTTLASQFTGLIDDVRIYAASLTLAQIQQLYVESVASHQLAEK